MYFIPGAKNPMNIKFEMLGLDPGVLRLLGEGKEGKPDQDQDHGPGQTTSSS